MARLFVAVWPDPAAVEVLAGLPRPSLPGVRWTRPEQWHVTLRFFGEAAPDPTAAALAGVAGPAGPGPATAVMGPVSGLLGRAVLQVPVTGLDAVAAAVAEVTRDIGRPPRPGPFRGHVTLARGRQGPDVRALAGAPLRATWAVGELTLVSSRPGPGGSRYQILDRFLLA